MSSCSAVECPTPSACTLKCRAYGRGMCSRTMWPPAWCAMPTAIPAGCAALPGCGTRGGRAMKYTVLATAVGAALAFNAWAGPEKIKFPSNYLKGVLYQTVDRADIKQYRELYAPAEVVEAVRKGKPIPDGAVLTLVQ